MNQGCPSYLIEHGDEVDVPLVHLGVGGAGDEGGVVVDRHARLQVVHDASRVGHRPCPHAHRRNLSMTKFVVTSKAYDVLSTVWSN